MSIQLTGPTGFPRVIPLTPDDSGRRLSVRVAEELKAMILQGRLEAGDRLPNEAELSARFGVSRITVREAMQMLLAFGLVESTRGRGTFVKEPDRAALIQDLAYFAFDSAAAVQDLFEVRRLLETHAGQRAALASDSKGRAQLVLRAGEGSALLEAPIESATDRLVQLDAAFHLEIAHLSGNPVLERLMSVVVQLLNPVRVRSLAVPGQAERSWHQHQEIAAAIVDGAPELAAARLVEHIEGVKSAILQRDE